MADIKSEWWASSLRNGGRHQSESADEELLSEPFPSELLDRLEVADAFFSHSGSVLFRSIRFGIESVIVASPSTDNIRVAKIMARLGISAEPNEDTGMFLLPAPWVRESETQDNRVIDSSR